MNRRARISYLIGFDLFVAVAIWPIFAHFGNFWGWAFLLFAAGAVGYSDPDGLRVWIHGPIMTSSVMLFFAYGMVTTNSDQNWGYGGLVIGFAFSVVACFSIIAVSYATFLIRRWLGP